MRRKNFGTILYVIIGALVGRGGDNSLAEPRPASPAALVEQALTNNPELKVYAAEIVAARGTVKTAGTMRNPELNTEAGYKTANGSGASGDGAALSISINQTFEYPGRIALRTAIAQGDVDLAALHLEHFRLTLGARVRALAFGIAAADERVTAIREITARFHALIDVLRQRPAAGVSPLLETNIIEANGLLLERQDREALLATRSAAAELNQFCGRPANAPLKVSAGDFVSRSVPLQVLLTAARNDGFEIRIREHELAQHHFKVGLARNERFPAIAVAPYYSQEKATEQEYRAGIGVSVPLPVWDRNAGNIATSKAREAQAMASLAATQAEVEKRVTQNAATFEANCAEIAKWKGDTLSRFKDGAELADRHYRLGAVALPVYVETQKQYFEMVGAVAELKKEALQAAQEVEALTGIRVYREEIAP